METTEAFLHCIQNFPSQEAILNHPARFKIVPKGRRYGMTRGKAHHLLGRAYHKKFQRALWVDCNYNNIYNYYLQYFFPCLKLLSKESYRFHKTECNLEVFDSFIDFRSATNPYSIEGFAYDDVFLNEAGIILQNEYLWDHAIRPMLMDYKSPALIAGTPKGFNQFEKIYEQALNYELTQPHGLEYKIFYRSTFHNPKIDLLEIEQLIQTAAEHTLRQEIFGMFTDGSDQTFAYAFQASKHVSECNYDADYPIYLSFDFNVSPMTCIVAQHFHDKIRIIDEFRLLNSNVYHISELVAHKYLREMKTHDSLSDDEEENYGTQTTPFYLTGDASGTNRSGLMAEQQNYFTVIMQRLNIPRSRVIIPKSNPPHTSNRVLVNAVLSRHPDFKIDPRCKYLIEDLKQVRITIDGKIDKGQDPLRTHLLDCLRYYLNTFHADFCKSG